MIPSGQRYGHGKLIWSFIVTALVLDKKLLSQEVRHPKEDFMTRQERDNLIKLTGQL
jgi:hypothetical protein